MYLRRGPNKGPRQWGGAQYEPVPREEIMHLINTYGNGDDEHQPRPEIISAGRRRHFGKGTRLEPINLWCNC
jgi:hypothetical protein